MSSDTYIDFHSPESWEREPNWEIWSGFLNDLENYRKDSPHFREHYSPERISYSHNVTMDCNYDLWDKMRDEFRGYFLTEDSWSLLSDRWRELYYRAQNPPGDVYASNDNSFCRWDMVTPDEFDQMLREHLGYYVRFRID